MIVLENGLYEVIVEADSTVVEELLNEGPPQRCPFHSIVEDSRHLICRCICNILREGNKCADILANMGAERTKQPVVVEDPFDVVRSQIVADMIGMTYRRI
ncbi:hypothetical protein ACSBR2_020422 [Camellia fascicularis]